MKIHALCGRELLWQKVVSYAEKCLWRAGPFLAEKMRHGDFSEWERVVVAVENEEIIGFCTITHRDYIPDVSYTPYIGFIYIDENHRGYRHSESLIKFCMQYASSIGFDEIFIVSSEIGLYEKYGFSKIDNKKDVWGGTAQIFCREVNPC